MIREIREPVGLDGIKNTVKCICENAEQYKQHHPRSMIIHLDEHQGRSTLAEYITDMFYVNNVMDFSMSRKEFIEVDFSGDFKQFGEAMKEIKDATDYVNDDAYPNILVETGINRLAQHMGEQHIDDYLKHVEKISKTALLVIFVSETPNQKEKELLTKIKTALPHAYVFATYNYSISDYCEAIKEILADDGVVLSNNELASEVISNMIKEEKVANMKDAHALAETLYFASRAKEGKLILDIKAIRKAYPSEKVKGGQK